MQRASRGTTTFVIVVLIVLTVLLFIFLRRAALNTTSSQTAVSGECTNSVIVGDHFFSAEYAVTSLERERGLSNRSVLPENTGMMFIFNEPGHYSFWMKNMNFPLDLLWIEGGEVVDITHDAPPEGERPQVIYRPNTPATHIFEINGGLSDELGIEIGDVVALRYCGE